MSWSTDFSNIPKDKLLRVLVFSENNPDVPPWAHRALYLEDGVWLGEHGGGHELPYKVIAWAPIEPVEPYREAGFLAVKIMEIAMSLGDFYAEHNRYLAELARLDQRKQCVSILYAAVEEWKKEGAPQNTAQHCAVLRAQSWISWQEHWHRSEVALLLRAGLVLISEQVLALVPHAERELGMDSPPSPAVARMPLSPDGG